jgi:phosphatidylserine decarboxylase
MKLAKGSFSWIALPLACGVSCHIVGMFFWGIAGSVLLFLAFMFYLLTGTFLVFFRDPDRTAGEGIVACADGKIREISQMNDVSVGPAVRISTFMNIYNVHVNRMPFKGTIRALTHHPGGYLPAFRKESECNERVELIVDTSLGPIKIVQIAGTLARRIQPYIQQGDLLEKGDKIGIIKLGSRVDVYLPERFSHSVVVQKGDYVKAGEDTLASVNV